MERFTFKTSHFYYSPGEEIPTIANDNLVFISEPKYDPFEFSLIAKPKEYLVGPAIDRLYDYEDLGYTPEQLREIISKYESYERLVKSPNGLTIQEAAYTDLKPSNWKDVVMHAIHRASKDKDVSVSVWFRGDDVNVMVYPWPEEEGAE